MCCYNFALMKYLVLTVLFNVLQTSPPVRRDWADWGYWAFSLCLVLVGAAQAYLMFGTLGAIKRQAKIMEDNINLIINKDRMRIRIEVLTLSLPPAKEGAEYEECGIGYVLRFEGATRAIVVDSFVEGKVTDSPEPPYKQIGISSLLSPEIAVEPFTGPQKSRVLLYGLSRLQVEMIQNRKSFVHFFGSIKYRDFFERVRETSFCYTWIPRPLGRAIGAEGWEKSGPPEANRET